MTETTSQTPPTPPPPASGGDGFDRLRALGIARPADGRWVGGVAAGLARRWNIDPLLVRGIFVALTIVSGIGLLVYGIAWALLPEDDGRIHLQSATRGDVTAGLVGAGIFVLLFLGVGGPDHGPGPIWWGFPGIVIAGLLAVGIWWWATRSKSGPGAPGAPGTYPAGHPGYQPGQPGGYPTGGYPAGGYPAGGYQPGYPTGGYPTGYPPRPQGAPYTGGPAYGTPPPVPPRPPIPPQPPRQPRNRRSPATAASHRITRITLGIAVLVVAAVVIVDRTAGIDRNATVIALAAALGVIAAGIVAAGALGRRSGGLAPIGVLVAIALGLASAVAAADLKSADRISVVGDRDWRPTTAEAATLDYNLGVGDGTLWLTDPGILSTRGTEPVRAMAQVGAGTLTVVVPDGVPVEIHADIAGGQLVRPDDSRRRFDGARDDDTPEVLHTGPAGAPVMIVDARVGFGEIVIETATSTRVAPSVTPSAVPSVTPAATASAAAPTPTVPATTTTPEVTP